MATLTTSMDRNSNGHEQNNDTLPTISDSTQILLDAMPLAAALLSSEEKIITVNFNFLNTLSYPNKDRLIGKKPKDIFNCIYALDTIYENNLAVECRKCGENINVKEGKVLCDRFTERCNLTLNDEIKHYGDVLIVKISTSPFTLDGEQFTLLSVTDISNDIRRRLVERIFFHDVLNKASNITGILDVLNLVGNEDERSVDLYDSLKNTAQDLIKEIKYQRDLSNDENNELIPVLHTTSSLGILNSTRNEIINSKVANNKKIQIASSSIDIGILTDSVLLRRVLINMVKNALEATKSGGKVILGCEPISEDNFRFWVHNEEAIPQEVQSQLFNKETSTKSGDRGLGTFSMRLVGEKYLKGKVNFTSTVKAGTLFMIDLPKHVEKA
ncbi:MAG TPA: HAMP domain-containing sensor histidine kinase [Prolixibacteraceae bacterium]